LKRALGGVVGSEGERFGVPGLELVLGRENFTTKTFVANKRRHKYSLLTAGAKKANRQGSWCWDG
jgi:hypothetical protein